MQLRLYLRNLPKAFKLRWYKSKDLASNRGILAGINNRLIRASLSVFLCIVIFTISIPIWKPTTAFAAQDSSPSKIEDVKSSDEPNKTATVANNNINDRNDGAAASGLIYHPVKKTKWSDIRYVHDENNITMVDYKNLFGMHIGKVYNPNFIDDADWFLDNYEDHGSYYLIPYNYNWYYHSYIAAPWYGCEAQSKAMIMTIEKYAETGDQDYLKFSQMVLNGFDSTTLDHGGWFLGLASKYHNSAILNSQLFCTIALHAYYEDTGNEKALGLFKIGVSVLEKNIASLTRDCGTYYSLAKDRFVLHHQHPEYIGLLGKLYSITHSIILKKTLDKWHSDFVHCHAVVRQSSHKIA